MCPKFCMFQHSLYVYSLMSIVFLTSLSHASHLLSQHTRSADFLCHLRYDSSGVGRITADEFCAALSDLGVSTTTPKEGLDLADRFKASAGIPYIANDISYNSIEFPTLILKFPGCFLCKPLHETAISTIVYHINSGECNLK